MRTQPVELLEWEVAPSLAQVVGPALVQGLAQMLLLSVQEGLAQRVGLRGLRILHMPEAMGQMGLSLCGSTHDELLCGY